MRPTLLAHRKFRRLVVALDGDTARAVGSLELIWHAAYESGDDVIGDAVDVEAAAHWRGEPGALASALSDAGFIDGDGDVYTIHDLDDHAPDYVQKRRARELERRARGVTLRELRAAAGKAGGRQTASKRLANGGQVVASGKQAASKRLANGVTPAPAPAPAPKEAAGEDPPAPLSLAPDDAPSTARDAYPAALVGHSGGRFVFTKLSKGGAFQLAKAIKAYPDLAAWARAGRWLAAGGDAWRGTLDSRAIGDAETWIQRAQAWDGLPIARPVAAPGRNSVPVDAPRPRHPEIRASDAPPRTPPPSQAQREAWAREDAEREAAASAKVGAKP